MIKIKQFSKSDKNNYKKYFFKNGFVTIKNLFDTKTINLISKKISKNNNIENRDFIFWDAYFKKLAFNKNMYKIAKYLLNGDVEIQHTKYNNKNSENNFKIEYHQDYPFFPHTNFDLIAANIHLDENNKNNGGLIFLSGSHKSGVFSHNFKKNFKSKIIDNTVIDSYKKYVINSTKGSVSFHHCLAIHSSNINKTSKDRKNLVIQYRTTDSFQISGPVWKSTGLKISSKSNNKYIRFINGYTVENRGDNGRIYDVYGSFKPTR